MEPNDFACDVIARLLEQRTGQKLTFNRRWRIGSALAGMLRDRNIESVEKLATMIDRGDNPGIAQEVVEALLNNETYFFRDRATFDWLSQRILPDLAQRRANTRRLSIWSVGCSTGQESLSLAMLFAEQKSRWAGWHIDILGTDVSTSMIAAARAGAYSHFQIQRGLGVSQMLGFFSEGKQGWQVDDGLRGMIRYEVHNLLESPPHPGQFDLVLCRNVLLYFDGDTRGLAFKRLASAMTSDGHLMLGAGETVIGQTTHLVPDAINTGFYQLSPAARKITESLPGSRLAS